MSDKVRQFRALENLSYSDLIGDPDKVGQIFAWQGDITELYPNLLRFPDRVQLLIDIGAIEEIVEPPVKAKTIKTDKGDSE